MNYPLWDLPAPGLLIAVVAILHVFVSHFAVGGGLFLVVTEWKARRENDEALLGYLERHSRFFVLLTLVFGAVTGVGIWFTIGLVHPAATSSLINAFVWGWAIEWVFFFVEIAAAIVYLYGWDRLTARQHLTVGWIYFGSAWASLFVINGILTYMLTPGRWLEAHEFWAGFFNPTFWPSLVIRTLGAVGLAGIYALFTASWLASPELKKKLATYAALGWVLPLAILLPVSLMWYFRAAEGAGIPVPAILGGSVSAATRTALIGQPIAQLAFRTVLASALATILLVAVMFAFRRARFGRVITAMIMIGGLLTIGAAEWVRETLRKPFVIGSYMYVNGIRVSDPRGESVLARARYARQGGDIGHEVFRLECSACHTTDGYLAIRPLVAGKSSATIAATIERLEGWRERRMPPFSGTEDEEYELSVYLARLGGGVITPRAGVADGAAVFDAHCAMCHAADSDWPIGPRVAARSESELYDIIGRLPQRNDMMPPFEGSDAERRALAKYLDARS